MPPIKGEEWKHVTIVEEKAEHPKVKCTYCSKEFVGVSVMELYGTLWNFTFGEKFRNFMELFNVCYGTEQLWGKQYNVTAGQPN